MTFKIPTNQEVFEAGLVHLFRQGDQCRTASDQCSYGKTDPKAGCFIGGLIPVQLRYTADATAIEGTIDCLYVNCLYVDGKASGPEVLDAWAPFIGRDLPFLKDCQRLHDEARKQEYNWDTLSKETRCRIFHSRAVYVANKYSLHLPTYGELTARAKEA